MKKQLSILIYSLASGGAERVVSILINQLNDKYDITLFLMNETIFYKLPNNMKVVYLERSNALESGILKLVKLPFLAWKYKKYNSAKISISFMNRPNYINIIAKLLGMKSKVIISERAMPTLQHKNGMQGVINKFLIKKLYPKANLIIANSQGNFLDLKDNYHCTKLVTINNPINITNVQELSKEAVTFRDNKFTFITIGRLDSGKNHALLINAIKELDAKLFIIGEGEARNSLEELIKTYKMKDKVTLLGRQDNPYKFLSQADCFVFASSHEGFPNVLLEALACGLPVVSTDCLSGPREILSKYKNIDKQLQDSIEVVEHGILTPVDNLTKMKEAMYTIMKNEKLRVDLQQKAISRAKGFDTKTIINSFEQYINK